MIAFDKVIAKHIRYMPIFKINAQKLNNVNVYILIKRHRIAITDTPLPLLVDHT